MMENSTFQSICKKLFRKIKRFMKVLICPHVNMSMSFPFIQTITHFKITTHDILFYKLLEYILFNRVYSFTSSDMAYQIVVAESKQNSENATSDIEG